MKLDDLKKNRQLADLEKLPVAIEELCQRYEQSTTAIVNDALRERNYLDQTLPNTITPLRDNMKVAGEIFTIRGSKSLEIKNEMKERAEMLESLYPYSVVAWETSDDVESAQWGEVMTMAAKKRGCRGAVIDGGIRDTDEILNQDFPVFSRYRSSNGMLGRFRITGWQVPIRIGNVYMKPGDIIFSDIDSSIVIPRDICWDILLRAEEIGKEEVELKRWVREGLSAIDIVERGGYF